MLHRSSPVLALALFALAGSSRCATLAGPNGLTVTVERTGTYQVDVPDLAWHFAGNIGHSLNNMTTTSGTDSAGDYNEVAFNFQSDAARYASIRSYYNRRAVLFSVTCLSAASNSFSFPALTVYPQGLSHITYSGAFAHPSFAALSEESPFVFFDPSGNTFILSAAANFMTASTSQAASGQLTSGISAKITSLPQGFSHRTVLVIDSGINSAFDSWGRTLTGLYGKARPANDADTTLARLGYWTDAGAAYYYAMQPGMSYTGTLAAVKRGFDSLAVGLGYVQLDSWFYPKGAQADWTDTGDGIYQYAPAAPLFGMSLAAFQHSLGVPLVTHARWIDPSSPYRNQYSFSGGVSTDPRYWGDIAAYLASSNVTTFEQDWLSGQAQTDFNLADPDAFLDNMAAAMAQRNITIQYCMATPRHFLQGVKYGNLTSIRTSQDRFDRTHWTDFLFASRLAAAVGVFPFADNLRSTEAANLLLSTLSGGPVGVGDSIGSISPGNLLRVVRRDGVIVKPDVPVAPIDASYFAGAASAGAAMVAATWTDFGGLRPAYVFAYGAGANYRPSDLGFAGPVFVFDYFAGQGHTASNGDGIDASIATAAAGGAVYQIVSPIGPSGMAIIGDTGQFVTLGRKRVAALSDDGVVHLTLAFAPGETTRTISGFSPDRPQSSAGRLVYDPSSHRFGLTLTPGPGGTAVVDITRGAGSRPSGSPHRPAR